jgi:hypothetical protein
MKLDVSKIIVIKDDITKIGFLPSTKEYVQQLDEDIESYFDGNIKEDSFKLKYDYPPLSFLMYGSTKEVDSNLLYDYIDKCSLEMNEKTVSSYRCFSGEKFGINHKEILAHATPLDSWLCLMSSLNNPEYGIIINMK